MNEKTDTPTITDSSMGLKPRLELAQAEGLAWEKENMPSVLEAMAYAAWNCCRNNFPLIGKVFSNGESYKEHGELSYQFDSSPVVTRDASREGMA